MRKIIKEPLCLASVLIAIALLTTTLPRRAAAQDQDDPPARVARLGFMQGSVSFQPAGEADWVQAVPNRPMTTGDRLWADQDSRAEVSLGSAVIRLAANTGFSFLNLDDRTVQIQLTSGAVSISVRRLGPDDDFEVDTPNLAFTAFRPGHYRVDASADGSYTVVSVRDGEGESTGNGQTYGLHGGQRATFSGTDSLYAEVVDLGPPDDFDNWAYLRDRRYERAARYVSPEVVGYEDLEDYGQWRYAFGYGQVWFPTQVAPGWAPYREGHWAWISPWGWTWVDDAPWGYAPFHYGRWAVVEGRWGWIPGPVEVAPVYAPALVVFIGAGGFGGNVGWFPLGPREVYVPSYAVSRAYVERVNVSNTVVNTTTITNVYNVTVINRTTTITNITYVNRSVAGAVTAVPQRAFVSAQPVAQAAVTVNAREMAAMPVSTRAAVAPARESVLGAHASTAGRVAAPPPAVASRAVVAKATPPPPPVPFAKQQQALAAHPGQPLEKSEVQSLRPVNAPVAQPMVKQAPPGKPAPTVGRAGSQPGNPPGPGRPSQPATPPPSNPPANAGKPAPPANPPASQPANTSRFGQPANAPPANPPANAGKPSQPTNPAPGTPPANVGKPTQPTNPPPAKSDRPPSAQPKPTEPAPAPKTQTPPPSQPARTPPPAAVQPASQQHQQAKPQTPEEKKREEKQKQEEEKPKPPQ